MYHIVTGFNWYKESDELEVRGVERSDMDLSEPLENTTVDEYYEHIHEVRRRYARLKATVAKTATEIHDSATMSVIEEREKATQKADKIPERPGPDTDEPQHTRKHGLDGVEGWKDGRHRRDNSHVHPHAGEVSDRRTWRHLTALTSVFDQAAQNGQYRRIDGSA